jgi:hypothetical protein
MHESESISGYIGRVLAIYNQMITCGDDLKEICVVEKILRSMPKRFNSVVISIEES